MITKFEKTITEKNILTNEDELKTIECLEKDAEFIHECHHDENPFKPCVRIKVTIQ